MRLEVIHFLSHVKDEQTIIAVITNLDAETFHSLIHHLEYTSSDTKERWCESLWKLLC